MLKFTSGVEQIFFYLLVICILPSQSGLRSIFRKSLRAGSKGGESQEERFRKTEGVMRWLRQEKGQGHSQARFPACISFSVFLQGQFHSFRAWVSFFLWLIFLFNHTLLSWLSFWKVTSQDRATSVLNAGFLSGGTVSRWWPL